MGLFRLSNELLDAVSRSLIPQMDTALGADPRYSSVTDGQRALLALVKSCRKLNVIATPYLYHTVCITDLGGLFDFLGVLVFNDHLTDLVRVLYITAPLDEYLDSDSDEKSEAIFARITPEMRAYAHLSRCFGDFDEPSELTCDNCNNYAESACALILSLVPRLEALYMHVPDQYVAEYTRLMEFFQQSCQKDDSGFADHLSLLSLTVDPRIDCCLMSAKTPHRLMGSGTIKHLELSGSQLIGGNGDLASNWRSLETVKALRAYTTGAWWYQMCKDAGPKLRKVDISIAGGYNQPVDPGQSGFNEAFMLCATSLESLRLDFCSLSHTEAHLGPTGRLSSLPSMQRLARLDVPLTLIFSSTAAMDALSDDICDRLPPSLRIIYLREAYPPWPASDMHGTGVNGDLVAGHNRLLKRSLVQMVLESSQKLPLLERVCIDGEVEGWDFDTAELGDLCTTDSRRGRDIVVDCVTLQSRRRDSTEAD
ncbi:hypothetical protein B0T14DRAFT_235410 [Immersiella caudata]|uniref:Uncharacterized protein n=1 Tax=Immersiella caudata TaxID=314043 RepID=A0AA40C0B9_9PEZI|nr:hypothetical protein B0T14DRAFT_235410 [Immersiella caudata]